MWHDDLALLYIVCFYMGLTYKGRRTCSRVLVCSIPCTPQYSYHFLHCLGMLLIANREFEAYDALYKRQGPMPWGDCPLLPPLGTSLDDLCDHPLCDAMGKISAEQRRRAMMTTTTAASASGTSAPSPSTIAAAEHSGARGGIGRGEEGGQMAGRSNMPPLFKTEEAQHAPPYAYPSNFHAPSGNTTAAAAFASSSSSASASSVASTGTGGEGVQGGASVEQDREEVENVFNDLSVEEIEKLGELFGAGSDFPAYEVF